jgi:hypothetical protein
MFSLANLVFCGCHSGCEAVKLTHQISLTKEKAFTKKRPNFMQRRLPFEFCLIKNSRHDIVLYFTSMNIFFALLNFALQFLLTLLEHTKIVLVLFAKSILHCLTLLVLPRAFWVTGAERMSIISKCSGTLAPNKIVYVCATINHKHTLMTIT